eukprot:632383-Pyramimonas_sp.AAC.1
MLGRAYCSDASTEGYARRPPNGVVTTPCGESLGILGHRTVLGLGLFSEDVSGDRGLRGPKTVR